MSYVLRFMVVTDPFAALARQLAEGLAGPAGAGMFSCPLSPTGKLPATHWLTEGWIERAFADLLADPAALYAACLAASAPVTQEQINALLAAATVAESEGNPIAQAEALGLKPIQAEASL